MTTKTDIQKTTSKRLQNVAEKSVFCHSSFTGKELDLETGFSYFGSRYLDHTLLTSWFTVDPMSDKYPSISPYAYCGWNPVKLVDPDGMDTIITINIDNGEISENKGSAYLKGCVVNFSDMNGFLNEYSCTGNISYQSGDSYNSIIFEKSDDAKEVYDRLIGKRENNNPSSVEWCHFIFSNNQKEQLVTSGKKHKVSLDGFDYTNLKKMWHYHPYDPEYYYYLPSKEDIDFARKSGAECYLQYCNSSYRFDNIPFPTNVKLYEGIILNCVKRNIYNFKPYCE